MHKPIPDPDGPVWTERLTRPGFWMLLLLLPLLSLLLWVMSLAEPEVRPALVEVSIWAFVAWPLALLSFPSLWQSGSRPAALGRGLGRVAAFSLALGPAVSLLAMWVAYANLEFFADHALGSTLLLLIIGNTLGRRIASGELRDWELMSAQRQLDRLEWMERREPFSPALLTRLLDGLSQLALREPAAAEAGLLSLASLYRDWLGRSEEPLNTLEAERDLGLRLADLHQLCGIQSPQLHWEWDPGVEAMKVPALFLQPLLESCFNLKDLQALRMEGKKKPSGVDLRIQPISETSLLKEVSLTPALDLSTLNSRLEACLGTGARVQYQQHGDSWWIQAHLPGGLP